MSVLTTSPIAFATDKHVVSKRLAFISNNRPIDMAHVKTWMEVIRRGEYQSHLALTGILDIVDFHANHPDIELRDADGNALPEADMHDFLLIIDGQHHTMAFLTEELGMNRLEAECMLLKLFNEHTSGDNDAHVHTSILALQKVTRQGKFVGYNSLKHAITSMVELRLTNPDDITSDRYLEFTKHRRSTPGIKLYYEITHTKVRFDEDRYITDKLFRQMHKADETYINNINSFITKSNENTRL